MEMSEMNATLLVNALRSLDDHHRHHLTVSLIERNSVMVDAINRLKSVKNSLARKGKDDNYLKILHAIEVFTNHNLLCEKNKPTESKT